MILEKAENFRLKSTTGELLTLDDAKGPNGTLIMFICNHCPYVKAVIFDIVEDCKKLKDLGVNSQLLAPMMWIIILRTLKIWLSFLK